MINYQDKETIKNILRRYKRIEEEKNTGNYEAMILLADLHEKLNKINLTQREKDILELYREGYTQKEIADALNFHQNHFNRHINSIAYKLIESGYKMV